MPAAPLRGWVRDSQRDAEPNNREITLHTFYGSGGAVLAAIAGYDRTWRVEVAPAPGMDVRPHKAFQRIIELHGSDEAEAKSEAEALLREHHAQGFIYGCGAPAQDSAKEKKNENRRHRCSAVGDAVHAAD